MAPSDCNFLGWELKWSIKNTRVLHGLHLICQNLQMINIPVVGPRRSWLGPSDIKTSRTLSQFFGLPSADPQQHARKTQHVHSAAIWPKWSLYNPSDLFPLDLDTRCQARQYLVFLKEVPFKFLKNLYIQELAESWGGVTGNKLLSGGPTVEAGTKLYLRSTSALHKTAQKAPSSGHILQLHLGWFLARFKLNVGWQCALHIIVEKKAIYW